jgi:hypothetical protein
MYGIRKMSKMNLSFLTLVNRVKNEAPQPSEKIQEDFRGKMMSSILDMLKQRSPWDSQSLSTPFTCFFFIAFHHNKKVVMPHQQNIIKLHKCRDLSYSPWYLCSLQYCRCAVHSNKCSLNQ